MVVPFFAVHGLIILLLAQSLHRSFSFQVRPLATCAGEPTDQGVQ
jgi:hypothetical protein